MSKRNGERAESNGHADLHGNQGWILKGTLITGGKYCGGNTSVHKPETTIVNSVSEREDGDKHRYKKMKHLNGLGR